MPDRKYDDCTYDRRDYTRTLIRPIPVDQTTEKCSNLTASNPQPNVRRKP
jgi:hypothetical protein